jgi:hypothetical protein
MHLACIRVTIGSANITYQMLRATCVLLFAGASDFICSSWRAKRNLSGLPVLWKYLERTALLSCLEQVLKSIYLD